MGGQAEKEVQTAVESSRRVDARYPATAVPGIKSVRLSPGDTVTLLNISASGVLVEGKTRFVPGTRVTVVFDGDVKPKQAKGRVVRCQVSAIGNAGSLQYQSGIALETRLTLPIDEPAEAPNPEPAAKTKEKKAAEAPAPLRNRW
jgi:PilZ domain